MEASSLCVGDETGGRERGRPATDGLPWIMERRGALLLVAVHPTLVLRPSCVDIDARFDGGGDRVSALGFRMLTENLPGLRDGAVALHSLGRLRLLCRGLLTLAAF